MGIRNSEITPFYEPLSLKQFLILLLAPSPRGIGGEGPDFHFPHEIWADHCPDLGGNAFLIFPLALSTARARVAGSGKSKLNLPYKRLRQHVYASVGILVKSGNRRPGPDICTPPLLQPGSGRGRETDFSLVL